MAMTAAGLKAVILSEMASKMGAPEDATKAGNFADAMATAIVSYLQSDAKAQITSGAITTTGSATTQTGPASPVLCAIL